MLWVVKEHSEGHVAVEVDDGVGGRALRGVVDIPSLPFIYLSSNSMSKLYSSNLHV